MMSSREDVAVLSVGSVACREGWAKESSLGLRDG